MERRSRKERYGCLSLSSTIQDDLRNAGANWIDQEVVIDGNLVTSRGPQDIPTFIREMIRLFTRSIQAATP